MTPPPKAPSLALPLIAFALGFAATALIPINTTIFWYSTPGGTMVKVFMLMGVVQFLLGMVAGVLWIVHFFRLEKGGRWWVMVLSLFAILVGLGGPIGMFLGFAFYTALAGHAF